VTTDDVHAILALPGAPVANESRVLPSRLKDVGA
jgi:hypothetical protein